MEYYGAAARPDSAFRGRKASDGRAEVWPPKYAVRSSRRSVAESIEEAMWQMTLQPRGYPAKMNASVESYPERPGEPDCAHYLRTGLCGYGANCRFNHPVGVKEAARNKGELPERVGHYECQFYLRTGTCKFGATCKYHHPRDRAPSEGQTQLNLLGLPMRTGEKECTYYMRTGSCKYGLSCKFDHPLPAAVGTLVPLPSSPIYASSGSPLTASTTPYPSGLSSWPSPRMTSYVSSPRIQALTPYMSVVFSPHQGIFSTPGWGTYQAPANPLGSPEGQQQLRGMGLVYSPTQPNDPSVSGVHGIFSPFVHGSSAVIGIQAVQCQTTNSQRDTFPERPGHPECQFYMKTGDCKFGSGCRYHHPKERLTQSSTCKLSPIGLPLRPTQPACTFYSRYGVCKFGPTCKFDHPLTGLSYSPSASSLSELPVAPYPTASSPTMSLVQPTSSDISHEIVKNKDQPLRSEESKFNENHASDSTVNTTVNAVSSSDATISSESLESYSG